MNIRKIAADFYHRSAKGTELEGIMTPEAADNLGRVAEICIRSRQRRNALKKAQEAQSVSGVGMKDIVVLAVLLAGYIFANSIAPVISTEQGTVDPQVSYSRF